MEGVVGNGALKEVLRKGQRCGTWSLASTEEHRLGVFKNGLLRKIFGSEWEEVAGTGENCIMSSIMIGTVQQTL
jgi:hypothetical protein